MIASENSDESCTDTAPVVKTSFLAIAAAVAWSALERMKTDVVATWPPVAGS